MRGRFITFEGGEGTGKSTQAAMLADRLKTFGLGVVLTREPGGSPGAEAIRHVILSGAAKPLGPHAEAILFAAARDDHVRQVIRPALVAGHWVISDRFADSTLVYQGSGRGLDIDDLSSVISFATAGLRPDMTILLDLPVEIGLARKHAPDGEGWNRFEAEALAFHSRVRDGYRALANREPARWRCLDGLQSAEKLADEIWRLVAKRMEFEP